MPPKRKAKASKSIPVPHTLPELEIVLRAFLGGEDPSAEKIDQTIRAATETLRAFIKLPQSVPALFSRVAMTTSPTDTRQLACVLLTKNIPQFWSGLQKSHMLGQAGKSDAQVCREHIMTILHSGDAPPQIIHSLSYLTSVIARLDLRRDRWPALPQWLLGALQSTNAAHVDAALRILYSVLESQSGEKLKSSFTTYFQAFLHWIVNAPTPTIRHRAVLATNSLLFNVHEEDEILSCLQQIIPVLLQAAPICERNYEVDTLKSIISIFASSAESPGFDDLFPSILSTLCPIIVNPEVDLLIRDQISQLFADYIASVPLLISQEHTFPDGSKSSYLPIFLQIISTLITEEDDDPFNTEEQTPQKVGVKILDHLFKYLSRDLVYPIIVSKFPEFVQSQNPTHRRAAYTIAMICSQMCPIQVYSGHAITLGGKTGPLLEIGLEACCAMLVIEQDPIVKHAICLALTYFGEELQGVMEAKHLYEKPLQAVLSVLGDATGPYRRQLFMVLDAMVTTAGERLVPYLPQIMHHLSVQLNLPDIKQQEASISAITAIAFSVDEHFLPYFEQLLPLFTQILTAPTTPQIQTMQEKSLVAFSACAKAIGIQSWSDVVRSSIFNLIQKSFDVIFRGNLAEYSTVSTNLVFLGNCVSPLGELPDYSPEILDILTKTYDACLRVIRSLVGVHWASSNVDAPTLRGFDDADDSEEEPDLDDEALEDVDHMDQDQDHYFDQEALECKASAMGTISLLLKAMGPRLYLIQPEEMVDDVAEIVEAQDADTLTPEQLQEQLVANQNNPFGVIQPLQPATPQAKIVTTDPVLRLVHVVIEASGYLSDNCLSQGFVLLKELLVLVIAKMVPITKQVGVRVPLPLEVVGVSAPIIVRYLEALTTDDDLEVVATVLYQFTELFNVFGCSILGDGEPLTTFYEGISNILDESAPCLVDSEYRDESSDHGEETLEAACELLCQLSETLGPIFKTEFLDNDNNLKSIVDFTAKNRPDSFRSMAIGCLAEILEHIGPIAGQSIACEFFGVASELLKDPSQDVRHNAMYFVGECVMSFQTTPQAAAALDTNLLASMFQDIILNISAYDKYLQCDHQTRTNQDNAVAAALKFTIVFPNVFPSNQILPNLGVCLPLIADTDEAVKVVLLLPQLYTSATDAMKPHTGRVLAQIAMILHQQLHEHRPQDEPIIIQFAKQLIQQFPAEASQAAQVLNSIPSYSGCVAALEKLAQPQLN